MRGATPEPLESSGLHVVWRGHSKEQLDELLRAEAGVQGTNKMKCEAQGQLVPACRSLRRFEKELLARFTHWLWAATLQALSVLHQRLLKAKAF